MPVKTSPHMDNLTIRPAGQSDYPAIAALIDSPEELFTVFPGGHWPFDVRQVHRLAEQRLDLTVCVNAGRVSGFANLYNKQPGQWAFIGNLLVSREARGEGIGYCLLKYMLTRVFERHDLPQARLSVFSHNRPALNLYEKAGFVQYDQEVRSAPSGKRVTLLHLKLDRNASGQRPI